MPRQENPLERDGTALVEFAADLRKLRDGAGKPPYREMARRAHFSSSTLSDAAGGKRLPSLAVTLAFVRACGANTAEWEERWHALAAGLNENSEKMEEPAAGAPYVGLAAYGPDDAGLFFGRERLVEDILARTRGQRFVAVFGPSGAGKSSVLRAGVIPELRKGTAKVVLFTPGAHPLRECAIRLAPLLATTVPTVERDLAAGPTALISVAEQLLTTGFPDADVVFVVDQFEEVFTLCADVDERNAFLALLLAATKSGSRCRVVLGVRADFYAHCAQHVDLAVALQDAQVTVGPMTADELRRAITQPARVSGCAVETDLLSVLIAHTHRQPGSLPLLSHALLQTWRRRKGNTLTLAGFQATGGIEGALARTAETTFGAMTTAQQNATQLLFRRLIALGDGTEDTKRRVRSMEFDVTPDTHAVLTVLGENRLLTLDRDTVEITHEALISAWPRLQRWLNADREGHRLHRELTEAAVLWQTHDREASTLLRGNRLTLVAEWAVHGGALSRVEQDFLDASVAARKRENSSTRRQIRRQRVLIAVLVVLVVSVSAVLVFAANAQRDAAQQRNTALALRAVQASADRINGDAVSATEIALAAYQIHPSADTGGALISALAATTSRSVPGAFEHVLVADDVLVVADIAAGTLGIHSISGDGLKNESSVPFSGRIVQMGLMTGMNGKPGPLTRPARIVHGPAISPDGDVLLAPAANDEYVVWDISDVRAPVRKSTMSAAEIVDWAPDGRHVLAVGLSWDEPGSGWSVRTLWNLSDLAKPVAVTNVPGTGAWFAGRHDLLVTTQNTDVGHTLAFHDVSRGQTDEPRAAPVTMNGVFAQVAFSADGQRLTVVDETPTERRVSTWRLDARRTLQQTGTRSFRPETLVSVHSGADDPVISVQTEQTVALWDSRVLSVPQWILPLPAGNQGGLSVTRLSSRFDELFVVMNVRNGRELRRLELDATSLVSRACRKTAVTRGGEPWARDVWEEHFPGVTPFLLCPQR